MKKGSMKLLAAVISLTVAVSMLSFASVSFAAEKEQKEDYSAFEDASRQIQNLKKDAFDFRTEKDAAKLRFNADNKLPKKYDLRDVDGKCYVTPVKFQNPFGSCWGFAAIAAAETSILGSGLAEQDGYDYTDLDLSEKHLINFHVRPIEDKNDPQYGEGMYVDPKYNYSLEQKFDLGGLPIYATSLFAAGQGPNREDRTLPSAAPEGTPKDIYEYHGLNKRIDKRLINGTWTDFCYLDDDDWSVPAELRYTQSYVLRESFMLPSPADQEPDDPEDINNPDATTHYVYDPDGTRAIKEQLTGEHPRAVEIGFHADTSRPDETTDGQYISKNWAHYTDNNEEIINHAVTIIGYDDDYPRENFVEGHQPPQDMFPEGQIEGRTDGGNGAWLVKNSWGSGEQEFPNNGGGTWGLLQGQDKYPYEAIDGAKHTGYFWISYYDKTLALPEALDFDESNEGKEYYIDMYDNMPIQNVSDADTETRTSMANVFHADMNELLDQISFQTTAPNTKVEYSVYRLRDGFTDPEDGIKARYGVKSFDYGGFHKIKMYNPIKIQRGQSYSIVITMKTTEDKYNLNIYWSYGEEISKAFDLGTWVKGVVNPGESYVKLDDQWNDFADEDFRKEFLGSQYYVLTYDNFPIKGYLKAAESDLFMRVYPSENVKLAPIGEAGNQMLMVTLAGSQGAFPESSDIQWECVSGSEFFTFNVDDSVGRHVCTVTPIKPGTGYLKVSIPDVGTRVIRVDVTKEGKYFAPDYTISYGEVGYIDEIADHTGTIIADYSDLTFTSDDPKIVTVSSDGRIKGVGVGKTKIHVSDSIGADTAISVKVVKAEQDLSVKGRKPSVSYTKLKRKAQTIKQKKAMTIRNAVGKKTFKKVKGNKKISVNKKNGNITVKKGLKKGKYKVQVKVTAAGNKNYRKGYMTDTVIVVVK